MKLKEMRAKLDDLFNNGVVNRVSAAVFMPADGSSATAYVQINNKADELVLTFRSEHSNGETVKCSRVRTKKTRETIGGVSAVLHLPEGEDNFDFVLDIKLPNTETITIQTITEPTSLNHRGTDRRGPVSTGVWQRTEEKFARPFTDWFTEE